MTKPSITVVLQPHDFIVPLRTGDVVPEGIDLRIIIGPLSVAMGDETILASELSFARHIRRISEGDRSWVAMPAFIRRGFNHRCWYVRKNSPIKTFRDLNGKRVGTIEWRATGNIWTRAIARERGLDLNSVHWVVGSINGGKFTAADELPGNVAYATSEEGLVDLLVDGRLDALACPDPPTIFYANDTKVVRLVGDYRAAERDYYRRTGIFPTHHIVGVRRSLFEKHPASLVNLYDALERSKDVWATLRFAECDTSPWLLADLEDTIAIMGADWQSYGIEANYRTIQHLCKEMLEQGLIKREVQPAELFQEFADLVASRMQAPVA